MADPQAADPLDGLVQTGIQALREGDRAGARSLFRALARRHPDDLRLWLWLAAAAETNAERRGALEQALALDPQNPVALKGLASLDGGAPPDTYDPAAGLSSETTLSQGRRSLQLLWLALLIVLLLLATLLLTNPRAWSWVRGAPGNPTPVLGSATLVAVTAAPVLAPTPLRQPAASINPGLPAASAPVPPATLAPTPAPLALRPQPVPAGTFFERDGWRFGLLAGTQSVTLDRIGDLAPQGRFVVVLLTVANAGPTPRPLDAGQISLVDGQGRSYAPQPAASAFYLDSLGGRGVAGDLSFGEPVPNTGGNLSIPVAFDLPLDASELLLVVRSGDDQMGWSIVN